MWNEENDEYVLLHNLRRENKTDAEQQIFIGQILVSFFVQMGENCKKWLKFLILLAFSAII